MDLTTLSHELNMSVQELRQKMRLAGFRVSAKARKVENSLAKEIVKKLSGQVVEEAPRNLKPQKIEIPEYVTVKEFAAAMHEPVTEVIKKLLQNGVAVSINEEIDADTAAIIGQEFRIEVEVQKKKEDGVHYGLGFVTEVVAKEDPKKLQSRPPIVAVMGHVDHGKTTLLDKIRKTNVAGEEAGAITQHIGAYQIEHQGKLITFLDTPGHEAFAAMRARGANVTDIIVLVVAADDSVKPQTVEVINRAKLAKTPMIVAINKIDKPGANLERVKGDLANLGVMIEEWGGKTSAVPISAKTGEGLDKLLETILLLAEIEELKANPGGFTVGTVIESHLSKGQGPIATTLIQNGTLQIGDPVVVGGAYGKIRAMETASGAKLRIAPPSTPVAISGLSEVPEVGNILRVTKDLEAAKSEAIHRQKQERAKRLSPSGRFPAGGQIISPDQKELKIILRADVAGSLGVVSESLIKLGSDEVKVNLVGAGVGEITESDIGLAEGTKGIILGFHTKVAPAAARLAKLKNIKISSYDIIYELVEDITSILLSLMPVEVVEVKLGRAKLKAVFRTEKTWVIAGGEVLEGKLVEKKRFRIIRNKQIIGEGKLEELQQNRIEIGEVPGGKEFGMKAVELTAKIEAGDMIEAFDETVKKKDRK